MYRESYYLMAQYEIKDGVGIIPEGTMKIDNYAFDGNKELTSITIPDSVTEIGGYAFAGCTGLTSIAIPDSVTEIGGYAFSYCENLTSISICNSVTVIGEDAFQNCKRLDSIIIPNSVTEIGPGAFKYCSGLTSIVIPESVRKMGNFTFCDCSGLKTVDIKGKLSSIGYACFSGCVSLESITLCSGIGKINDYAFPKCTSLKAINVPAKKTDYYVNRLPNELQALVMEPTGQTSVKTKPVSNAKPKPTLNQYKVTFRSDCILGVCAKFLDDYEDVGNRIDFEQDDGHLSKEVKKILLVSYLNLETIVDVATGKILKPEGDFAEETGESWVEQRLGLEKGNRYYIQGMQERYGGTFSKKITFVIKTPDAFDIKKLSLISDTKFDDLYWKIKKSEAYGEVIGDIEPEEGLYDPYHIVYDGKKVSSNSISINNNLRGESYMYFRWGDEE